MRYEEVMNGDLSAMRELFKRPLVYIFHDTIDEASHSQSPFEVIAACRKAIEQLTVLVRRLHATWNVTNVLLTADHGFIYNDQKFEEKDKHSITEDALEKKTRYYLTEDNRMVDGIMKFPLDEVSGMKGTGLFVAVPEGTNRLAAPGGYNFAHGGASLQELIIPVIKSVRKKTDKTEKAGTKLLLGLGLHTCHGTEIGRPDVGSVQQLHHETAEKQAGDTRRERPVRRWLHPQIPV